LFLVSSSIICLSVEFFLIFLVLLFSVSYVVFFLPLLVSTLRTYLLRGAESFWRS